MITPSGLPIGLSVLRLRAHDAASHATKLPITRDDVCLYYCCCAQSAIVDIDRQSVAVEHASLDHDLFADSGWLLLLGHLWGTNLEMASWYWSIGLTLTSRFACDNCPLLTLPIDHLQLPTHWPIGNCMLSLSDSTRMLVCFVKVQLWNIFCSTVVLNCVKVFFTLLPTIVDGNGGAHQKDLIWLQSTFL